MWFPGSRSYGGAGEPVNADQLGDVAFEDLVKVMGSKAGCEAAIAELQAKAAEVRCLSPNETDSVAHHFYRVRFRALSNVNVHRVFQPGSRLRGLYTFPSNTTTSLFIKQASNDLCVLITSSSTSPRFPRSMFLHDQQVLPLPHLPASIKTKRLRTMVLTGKLPRTTREPRKARLSGLSADETKLRWTPPRIY